MTPLLSKDAFAALGAPGLVYVREIKAREVLAGQPLHLVREFSVDPDQTLYALHAADGARLAVLEDRDQAITVALANSLAPVSVH